jgi:hypothetical protein
MAKDWTQDPRLDPGDGQDRVLGAHWDALDEEVQRDLQEEHGDLYAHVLPLHTRHLRIVREQPHPRERREHRLARLGRTYEPNNDGPGLPPEAA